MRKILNLPPRICCHAINLNLGFTEEVVGITEHSNNLVILLDMIIAKTEGSEATGSPIIAQRWRLFGDPNGGVPEKNTVTFNGETNKAVTRTNDAVMAVLVLDRVVKVFRNGG